MLLITTVQGYHTCPAKQKIGFMVTAAAGCGLFRTTFGKALLAAVIAWALSLGLGLIWAALAGLVMGVLLVLG
jgi:hypothetical protein